ncbi:plasmid mobilization protein [Neorhizobium galegae]|uniref:plasmid mobilization protein n=1 Tax=Neorhizobium galegae TaxID=399 RepID=UPI002107394A|nr:plasmid mobilization relaxosome protein MobC [Neorhizobium galegae]MCQ1855474.1 MobC family plasmid mobilization relaxosome protein [Neorhizobium galegae]
MSPSSASDTVPVIGAERKSRVVHARFGTTEISMVEEAAKAAGLTVSAFVRSLTLEGAGVRPFLTDVDRAVLGLLLSEVRAVGVNLNQLARAANRWAPPFAEEARFVADDVHRVLAAVLLELTSYAERGARLRSGKR